MRCKMLQRNSPGGYSFSGHLISSTFHDGHYITLMLTIPMVPMVLNIYSTPLIAPAIHWWIIPAIAVSSKDQPRIRIGKSVKKIRKESFVLSNSSNTPDLGSMGAPLTNTGTNYHDLLLDMKCLSVFGSGNRSWNEVPSSLSIVKRFHDPPMVSLSIREHCWHMRLNPCMSKEPEIRGLLGNGMCCNTPCLWAVPCATAKHCIIFKPWDSTSE